MTGGLLLRPPMLEDAVDALSMLQDPDVVRWNPREGQYLSPRVLQPAPGRAPRAHST